jgi:hypothetical protein
MNTANLQSATTLKKLNQFAYSRAQISAAVAAKRHGRAAIGNLNKFDEQDGQLTWDGRTLVAKEDIEAKLTELFVDPLYSRMGRDSFITKLLASILALAKHEYSSFSLIKNHISCIVA